MRMKKPEPAEPETALSTPGPRRNRRRAAGLARGKPLAIAALLALALTGCVVHARQAPAHHHAARAVVVPAGHVHSHRCGHYRHGGHWYHLAGHLHRRGCGHVFVGGVWVVGR